MRQISWIINLGNNLDSVQEVRFSTKYGKTKYSFNFKALEGYEWGENSHGLLDFLNVIKGRWKNKDIVGFIRLRK